MAPVDNSGDGTLTSGLHRLELSGSDGWARLYLAFTLDNRSLNPDGIAFRPESKVRRA